MRQGEILCGIWHLALLLGLLGDINEYISICSSKCNPTQVLTDMEEPESDRPRTLSTMGSSNQNSQTGWSSLWRTGPPGALVCAQEEARTDFLSPF